jgi:endoglucanase
MSAARPGLRRSALVVIPVLLFVVVFVGARVIGDRSGGNPFLDRPPLAASGTAVSGVAANASGDDRAILERLAKVPQGTWLTPEAYPIGQVAQPVRTVAAQAEIEGRTPVFVVYGITDRDCSGGESSGGLPADQYPAWVAQIADAMGSDAAVVVEPDALATAAECNQGQERTTLLRDAVSQLAAKGATVYLDAGHASWTDPAEMARLLKDAGVGEARGFSTNVAGYESEADERTYAEAVSAALGGAHYVTDTGRNGAGSNGAWCNPEGRALGREPEAADGDGARDAYLWIKPPGESDGTCGGGPPAGQFWTERAVSMARAAGW